MNVIDALVAHHGTLRQLYQQFETNPDVFDDFIHHLVVHHTMEEKYFYDFLEGFDQARGDALEAVNEHHILELIIKDVERFPRDHERFPIKVESLGEYMVHHLDEEETMIFPLALQVFAPGDLDTLGRLFQEAKDKLLGVILPEVPATLEAKSKKQPQRTAGTGVSGVSPQSDPASGLGIGSLK